MRAKVMSRPAPIGGDNAAVFACAEAAFAARPARREKFARAVRHDRAESATAPTTDVYAARPSNLAGPIGRNRGFHDRPGRARAVN